jgi:hypothetical protein
MAVFWVVAPCILVEALMMEAARTSETLVNFYQTTRRYNPEDSHLRTHRRENLKSYFIIKFPPSFCYIRGRQPFHYRRTALAIHIFVEGWWKRLIMSWAVSETLFNLKSAVGIRLKTGNSCVFPYNSVYCKDVVSFQTVLIWSHCWLYKISYCFVKFHMVWTM